MEPRLADSPHHRWKTHSGFLLNWKFVTVILIYCDIIDSKLNMGTETNYCGIGQARVHYGICPGSDFIEDEVGNKTEVSDSALDKGKIDINLFKVIDRRDIEHSNEGKSDDDIGPNLKPIFGNDHGEQNDKDDVVHYSVVVCKVAHVATEMVAAVG